MSNESELLKLTKIVPTIRGAIRSAGTAKQVKRHLLPKMDRVYRRSMDIRFQSENASRGVGGAWEALSPWYAKWKKKQVGSQPILSFTRGMRASFIGAGHRNHIMRLRKGVVTLGSNHKLAAQHDRGQGVPQRMLRGASPETVGEFKKEVILYVRDFLAGRIVRDINRLNSSGLSVAQQGVDKKTLMRRLGEFG